MSKKPIAIFLALLLLVGLTGCQSEQDRKFDELIRAARDAQSSDLLSELEIDYDSPNYIGPPKGV